MEGLLHGQDWLCKSLSISVLELSTQTTEEKSEWS